MVLYGVRLMINIFDMFIYQRYLEVFLGKRKTSMEQAIALLVLCAAVGSIVNQMNINWLNLITMISILIVYICQYEKSVILKGIAVLIYMGIIVIVEPVGYIIYSFFIKSYHYDKDIVYFLIVFCMELFKLIIVEGFCRIKGRKTIQIFMLPKQVLYLLSAIPLVSLIACFLVIEIATHQLSAEMVILCMSIIFTIVISNYLIFTMISRYSAMEENRHEEELMIREIVYKDEYYQDVERYQDEIQYIKHDMKNQLIALYDTISEDNHSEIKEKLEEMLEGIRKAEDILYSSNPILNSILKVKVSKAKEQGIHMNVHAFIPKKISIESGDMGVLYGNLLDNAVEACQRIKQEDKFIEFETKYQNGKLLICITNSKIPEQNLSFLTTKKDKRFHGRGIKTVRIIAEKYQGTLFLEDKGNAFEASLLLTGIACLE